MGDRDDPARDDRKSPVRLPGLVVWEEERTGVEKVLDRIRRLLGGGAEEPDEQGRGASGGRAPSRAPLEPMPLPDTRREGEDELREPPEPPDAEGAEAEEPADGGEVDAEEHAIGGAAARPSPPSGREPLQRATLQMLPGRFEPVNPRIVRQELRFLRAPGPEQEVTVGSETSDPPGHVTIDHASVQPYHARLRFAEGTWTIESLTDVDPVRLNREPLEPGAGAHPLADGDTVRFGRAEFVFRIS